jgi:hypothetical protein
MPDVRDYTPNATLQAAWRGRDPSLKCRKIASDPVDGWGQVGQVENIAKK